MDAPHTHPNGNGTEGHTHAEAPALLPIQTVRIQWDPNTAQYQYFMENCDYRETIAHMELVKLLAFHDLMIRNAQVAQASAEGG